MLQLERSQMKILTAHELACWIIKITDKLSEYVIQYLLLFHSNNRYANAPQCYDYTCIACLIYYYNQSKPMNT
jgi:hypothetical protein